MSLLLEVPLNRVSFGNVSFNIVRELHKREYPIRIFPIGEPDFSAFDINDELKKYIEDAVNNRWDFLKKDIPCLKLWHLNGSENRKTKEQYLFTFYECNEPTTIESSIASVQDHVFFSSNDARDNFTRTGVKNTSFVPLGLDEDFKITGKDYLKDTVHFGLMGKFENRKHTQKIIQSWVKKYGNNNKYLLTCCINNPFFKPEQMQGLIQETFKGKHYNNVNLLPVLAKNTEVNEFLNSIDIDLTGLSGGEGWNLPAFNSTCLGKWSIVLNCTSHKDWATKENSILINPSGTMPVADGMFFHQGNPFNQGTFYTWTEDEAISAMEEAEKKVGQINTEGVKLGDNMTYSKTVDSILSLIFKDK
jgi:hypothetical protein|tara:strand:+ start:2186 stop:3268 length:1083 start_codon:yes stop_codon:yes gene_type:complete